jgi:hypothetical protein
MQRHRTRLRHQPADGWHAYTRWYNEPTMGKYVGAVQQTTPLSRAVGTCGEDPMRSSGERCCHCTGSICFDVRLGEDAWVEMAEAGDASRHLIVVRTAARAADPLSQVD